MSILCLPLLPPKRVGYTFVGYFADKNGGKQYYDANGKSMLDFWDRTEDTTLYALWMVYAYTITFDRDGGTGGSDGVTATYGSDLAAITPPTKTGYSFAGYYDSETDGKQYYDEEGIGKVKWDIDANITLYARWTLQISCTFPSTALIKVDMEGKIEGETLAFSSTMVEDIEITEVRSIQDANASTVFTDEAILKEARVLLSPPGNIGTQIAIPLTANRISTPTGWIIKPNSSIDVLFDLSLPEQAQIDYIANDDGIPIAKLFYEVSVIPAAS